MVADAEKLKQLPGNGWGARARGQAEEMAVLSEATEHFADFGVEADFVPAGSKDLPGRATPQRRRQLIAPQQRRAVPEGEIEIEDDETGHGAGTP